MTYYARSENKQGEKETVAHHLQLASELAAEYARPFGEEQNAKCAALIHDVGKYTDIFQKVLAGTAHGINHAAVGAVVLYNCAVLKQIVFAHHSELKWDIDGILKEISAGERENDCDGKRVSAVGKDEIRKCMERFMAENKLVRARSFEWLTHRGNAGDGDLEFLQSLEMMLCTRMMYSCLVDADYTSSASHNRPEYLEMCKPKAPRFAEMYGALESYKAKLSLNSTSDEKVDRIRNKVYDDCINAAKLDPGMFTLTAPTGSGKTVALLAFALKHALTHNNKKRIIIVLPYLSIIEQNAAVYREICGEILEQHSMTDYHFAEEDEMLRIYSDRWSSDIIVTTSVNFFEGLFKNRASDCRRLHNIAESVIVFDEAQSLPVGLVDSCVGTLSLLCEKYKCSVVLSTATQPSFGYRKNLKSRFAPREIVKDQKSLFAQMKRTDVAWNVNRVTSFEEIALEMSEQNSCCCLVNLKKHCDKLYDRLSELCDDGSVFAISTNMCSDHRHDVLTCIKERLKSGKPCRIVSTQCIEAGVDLDVERIYRALAPLEAIIQSAGRCNRNGNLKRGKIVVFKPDEKKLYPDKNYKYAADQVLTLLARHDRNIDIDDPSIVDEYYELLYNTYSGDSPKLVNAVKNMDFDMTKKYSKFIKNDGVNVIVPYWGRIELYKEVTERIRNEGLTPKLERKARGITVTSYDLENIKDVCENAVKAVYLDGRKEKIGTNWYILSDKNLSGEDMYRKNGIHIEQNVMNYFV